MNRLRMTMVIVFCAYIAYVVAGLIFGKMVEYDDFQEIIDHNAQVGLSYTLLYAGAWISLGAVLLASALGGVILAFETDEAMSAFVRLLA